MQQGLLFVLSQPETVEIADFHDWYDHEHAPARIAFDGVENATRFRAVDEIEPTWLATYDVDLAVLERPDYRALREHRSEREQQVISGLSTFERRTYRLLQEWPVPAPDAWRHHRPGPVLVCVSLEVPITSRPELVRWYAEEHVPLLHRIEGWHRTRLFESTDDGDAWLLAAHDVSSVDLFDDPRWAEATSTSWRDVVMGSVTARERRVYVVHRQFGVDAT